ncbi:MAG TPA: DUF305 domain-containing protein [Mycobacterium sp.]|nr:DUF305 domain-containing protein [Mycobacterium sp.]
MTSTTTVAVGAAAVAAFLTLGACSNTSTEQAPPSSPSASTSAPAQAQAHNTVDAMFLQHMIPHHEQAIEMSDMILGKQGIDPRVTELAKQIKDAQGPEIEQMKSWLTEWGMPATMPGMDTPGHSMPGASETPGDSGGGDDDMPGSGTMPRTSTMPGGSMMPSPSMSPRMDGMPGMGMMSQADMDALKNAQGVEASKLYLTQMTTHHQGAIDMAQNEAKNGQNQAVVELAKSIITSQQKEIDTMKSILSSL